MTVEELITKLSSLDIGEQVLVRFMHSNAYGSCCKGLEDFDEYDVKVTGHTVIIDISDKYRALGCG